MEPQLESNQNLNVGNGFESSVQGGLVRSKSCLGSCHTVEGILGM